MLKFQNNNTTVIATFEDFILTTYVIIDELYHRFAPSEVKVTLLHLRLRRHPQMTAKDYGIWRIIVQILQF